MFKPITKKCARWLVRTGAWKIHSKISYRKIFFGIFSVRVSEAECFPFFAFKLGKGLQRKVFLLEICREPFIEANCKKVLTFLKCAFSSVSFSSKKINTFKYRTAMELNYFANEKRSWRKTSISIRASNANWN